MALSPKASHYITTGIGIAAAVATYFAKNGSGQSAVIGSIAVSVLALIGAQFSSSVLPSVNVAAAKDGAK